MRRGDKVVQAFSLSVVRGEPTAPWWWRGESWKPFPNCESLPAHVIQRKAVEEKHLDHSHLYSSDSEITKNNAGSLKIKVLLSGKK